MARPRKSTAVATIIEDTKAMATNSYQLITGKDAVSSGASIKKACDQLVSVGQKYFDMLHVILCSAVVHAQKYGDTRLLTDVAKVYAHGSIQQKQIDVWLRGKPGANLNSGKPEGALGFTNLTYGKNKAGQEMYLWPAKQDRIVLLDEMKDAKTGETVHEGMLQTPFWRYSADKVDNTIKEREVDFDKRIGSLIASWKRTLLAIEEGKPLGNIKPVLPKGITVAMQKEHISQLEKASKKLGIVIPVEPVEETAQGQAKAA